MSLSTVGPAVQGIQNGLTNLARNAQTLAEANRRGTPSPDVLGPLVNLPRDRLQVAASVQALKVADATIGTLLDVKA